MFRVPNYIFRPSQCDQFHFDFWYKGLNILRDAGSYSYNTSQENNNYFSGCKGHNSIQFENEEPMEKISNFLWANWLQSENIIVSNKKNNVFISASYKFKYGLHKRSIKLDFVNNIWLIEDFVENKVKFVTLRWRLYPVNWSIKGKELKSDLINMKIMSNDDNAKINLTSGWESLYYNDKENIPVCELKSFKKMFCSKQ